MAIDRWIMFRSVEARYAVSAYWHAVAAYRWASTRSCVATGQAIRSMNNHVDTLIRLGCFPPEKHVRMPTLDELDGITGR